MMDKLKLMQERLQNLFGKKVKEPQNAHIVNPMRDWKILLAVFAVCIVCGALFSGYVFLGVKAPIVESGGDNKKSVKLSESAMRTVLQKIEDRGVLYTQLRAQALQLADPSK